MKNSFITTTIAGLIEKNTIFEEELARQLSNLKKSQILALQGQINPHFIFNTINLIAMLDLSETKDLHPISEITYLMADILRYLKTDEYLVPLKTELEYLEKYTKLLFENEFKGHITSDITGTTVHFEFPEIHSDKI